MLKMFSPIKTFGYFAKGLSKSLINYKPLGLFSSYCSPYTQSRNQNANAVQPLFSQNTLSRSLLLAQDINLCSTRNVTKFSLKTGKRKTVYAVLDRFFRLHNGLWIRRWSGCHKRIHKRNQQTRYNFAQHIVCTRSQCIMLDKMVTNHVKKRKYYIDDPFEPYHDRHGIDCVAPVKKR